MAGKLFYLHVKQMCFNQWELPVQSQACDLLDKPLVRPWPQWISCLEPVLTEASLTDRLLLDQQCAL